MHLSWDYPNTQYWFVYCLTGLLFWTPFLGTMVLNLSLRKKLIMSLVVLVFQTVFVFLKDIGIYPGYELPLQGWPLFFLVGSFADEIPGKWKKRLIFAGIAAFALSLLQMRMLPSARSGLQDLSPKYFISTVALYYLIQKIKVPHCAEKTAVFIARYSYYIYLLHNTIVTLFFSEKLGLYDMLTQRIGTGLYLVILISVSVLLPLIVGIVLQGAVVGPLEKLVRKNLIESEQVRKK